MLKQFVSAILTFAGIIVPGARRTSDRTRCASDRTPAKGLRSHRHRSLAAQMIPLAEDDSDHDREPGDETTGFQVCVIIFLTFFIAVKAITEHPEWFGAQ